ncbi:hypothetical protein STSO111631_19055 [Stackebrandtia soli]
MSAFFSSLLRKKGDISAHETDTDATEVRARFAALHPTFAGVADGACTEIVDTGDVGVKARSNIVRGRVGDVIAAATDTIRARVRWERTSRTMLAFALMAVAAVSTISAWYAWPTGGGSGLEPVPVAHTEKHGQTDTEDADRTDIAVMVSVVGEVKRPGLVSLENGARVADAIEAAGGLTGKGVGYLNLARKVSDGELIIVEGDDAPADATDVEPTPQEPDEPQTVNLNQATAADLDSLPGIGPVMADRIIAYRDSNGGFDSVDQLEDVEGIGAATMAKLRDRVTV